MLLQLFCKMEAPSCLKENLSYPGDLLQNKVLVTQLITQFLTLESIATLLKLRNIQERQNLNLENGTLKKMERANGFCLTRMLNSNSEPINLLFKCKKNLKFYKDSIKILFHFALFLFIINY